MGEKEKKKRLFGFVTILTKENKGDMDRCTGTVMMFTVNSGFIITDLWTSSSLLLYCTWLVS